MSAWDFKLNQAPKKSAMVDPFGYSKLVADMEEEKQKEEEMQNLLEKKLWSQATSGASQILMVLFMNFMTGSSLNIFTIIFTFQFIYNPAKSIFGTSNVFKQFENKGVSLLYYKAIYAGIYGIILSIGLFKLYNLGLLPLHPSDWIDLIPTYHV